jgi:hypothetical protein
VLVIPTSRIFCESRFSKQAKMEIDMQHELKLRTLDASNYIKELVAIL